MYYALWFVKRCDFDISKPVTWKEFNVIHSISIGIIHFIDGWFEKIWQIVLDLKYVSILWKKFEEKIKSKWFTLISYYTFASFILMISIPYDSIIRGAKNRDKPEVE